MKGYGGPSGSNETGNMVYEQVAQPIAVHKVSPTITAKMQGSSGWAPYNETEHLVPVAQPKAAAFIVAKGSTSRSIGYREENAPTLVADQGNNSAVLQTMAIRRLTPKECERLQGFPDDWTKIPYRNKPAEQCPDGPRYKACGNSMAVPVMRWIGTRIQMIENYLNP
tara:strand:- start:428 stop:928 length:501 start_codon:yes stop_codon:yes gene_type:complete